MEPLTHCDTNMQPVLTVLTVVLVTSSSASNNRKWENEILDFLSTAGPHPTKLVKGFTQKDTPKRIWGFWDIPDDLDQAPFTTTAQTSTGHHSSHHDALVDRHPGRDKILVRKGSSKFMAPIHGHQWPFDQSEVPARPPVNSSYSVEGTYLWAVGLLGTVSNLAVVLTTVFSKKIRRPLHVLVGTLGLTDLFISLIYIPSYTYFLLESGREELSKKEAENAQWDFCVASRAIFIEIASVTLTIKTLIAIYLFMFTRCSKEVANQVFRVGHTCGFIVLAWALNFLVLFLPGFVGWDTNDLYPNAFVCYKYQRWRDPRGPVTSQTPSSVTVHAILTLVLHLVELAVICFCFTQVHRAILRGRLINRKHKLDDKESQMNYVKASKTTVLIFVSFCLCWVPIYIVNTADPTHTRLPVDLHRTAMDLLLTKSAINPFIYLYGLRSLRHEVKLFCLCRCRADNRNLKFEAPRTSSYITNKHQGEGVKSKSTEAAVEV